MVCFEVYVNDKKVFTAGHEDLDEITTSLKYQKDKETVKLSINGELIGNDSLRGYARWLIWVNNNKARSMRELKIGDEIKIIVNKDVIPDKPAFYKSGKEESSSEIKKFCSFCSKERKEVRTLIASEHKNTYICGECIDKFREIKEEVNKS
ncbi:MAG TPA: ClpX C4-type zinc finger protein [Thermodesulfobacteriota bacterium]|nr:ClpX C4-type zinc finger protein [Thermodesulfobacteriota bacterium]